MSALQDPELAFRGEAIKPMTRDEITRLEEKVSTYLSGTIKSTDVSKQVRRFFNASRLLTERQHVAKGQHGLLVDFVITQYRQIESLAKAFNDFETKNSVAFKSLSDYLSAINRFLNDSNKELYFDESTGKLVFSFADSVNRKRSGRSVSRLSSGERQILILFTFLAFASKSQSVFIVDEPELSLHPKWQADFCSTKQMQQS
jgi:predicted ATPase